MRRTYFRILIIYLTIILLLSGNLIFMVNPMAAEVKAAGISEEIEAMEESGIVEETEDAGFPEIAKESDSTERPEVTGNPDHAENPETTGNPNHAGNPETTKEPRATQNPEITEKAEATQTTETTEEPEATQAPETTEEPKTTQAPESTEEPETTQAPETTEKPETTQNPEATKVPETTAEPEEPPPVMEPEEVIHKPKIILTDCDLNGKETAAGTQEAMNAAFQNCSADRYAYNLKISVSAEPSGILLDDYSFYYGQIAPGESIALQAVVKTLPDIDGGTGYVYFNMEYEDEKGNTVTAKETAVFQILRKEAILRQPKMLLETCALADGRLMAGTAEPMEAVFKNCSEGQTIYNLKATVSTESPSIQFTGTSFYIPQVAPQDTVSLEGELKITAEADRGTAPLYFDFAYEDENGNAIADRETVMLTIEQPVKMELETEAIPGILYASDTVDLSLKALNLSRTSVYNVRISLSAQGLFPVNDIFIGNMDAGAEGTGTMNVYVGTRTMESPGSFASTIEEEKYGKISGTITLQYEDADGGTYTLDKEFQTEIKKPRILSLEVEEPAEENVWWISVFAVLIAGMAALVILLSMRLRRKNILLEEARKMMDKQEVV